MTISIEPRAHGISDLTDWAELSIYLNAHEMVSKADLQDQFSESSRRSRRDVEEDIELIFQEIKRRSRLATGRYPFRVEGELIFELRR